MPMPESVVDVAYQWRDGKAKWHVVNRSHARGGPLPDDPSQRREIAVMLARGEDFVPIERHIVFDGSKWHRHLSGKLASGSLLEVFTAAQHRPAFQNQEFMLLLPAEAWALSRGDRPWDQLLGPHPDFPDGGIEKWEVAVAGSKVRIKRHDRRIVEGKERKGVAAYVADLDLCGHVVQFDYRGDRQSTSGKIDWKREADGRVRCVAMQWTNSYDKSPPVKEEYEVLSFESPATIPGTTFDQASMPIRGGTPVKDHSTGRVYTFKAPPVSQQDLDRIIHKTRAIWSKGGKSST